MSHGVVEDLSNVTCGVTSEFNGQKVRDVTIPWITCDNNVATVVLVPLVCLALVVMTVRLCWTCIRYEFILLNDRLCRRKFTHRRLRQNEYDAFVSYSDEDSDWVLKVCFNKEH